LPNTSLKSFLVAAVPATTGTGKFRIKIAKGLHFLHPTASGPFRATPDGNKFDGQFPLMHQLNKSGSPERKKY
jgi:hypothetical protein